MHDDGSGVNCRNQQSAFENLESRPNVTISGATGDMETIPQLGTVIEGPNVLPNVLQTNLDYDIDSQYCLTEKLGYKIDLTKTDDMGRMITYYKQMDNGSRVERVYKRNRDETHKFLVSSVSTARPEVSALDLITIIRLLLIHEKMGYMAPIAMKYLLLNYSADILGYTLDDINLFIRYFDCASCRSGKSTYRLNNNAH